MKKAIYVRIEEGLIARLDEVAREQHRSRANLVETLVYDGLAALKVLERDIWPRMERIERDRGNGQPREGVEVS